VATAISTSIICIANTVGAYNSNTLWLQAYTGIGRVVRFGPNRVSINTNTALRDVYGPRANVQKARFYTVFSYFFKVPMIVTTISRKEHAFKKRILSQALTNTAIDAMEEPLLSSTRRFCQHLLDEKPSAGWNDARNITDWAAYVTSDIMGKITFNCNWNMMENKANRHMIAIISQGVAGLNLVSIEQVYIDRRN